MPNRNRHSSALAVRLPNGVDFSKLATELVEGCSLLADALSPAERRILPYLLAGNSEPEIAITLGLSRHTIHDHARNIYAIFGQSNRAHLILLFVAGQGQESHKQEPPPAQDGVPAPAPLAA